ncbi:MAG: hypothetical protein R3Y29_08970 [bacterium]
MSNYRKIENLLDTLNDIVNDMRPGLFGNKSFDKDEIFKIIDDIKYGLPKELKEAKKIIDNADKIMQDAHIDAKKLIKSAEEQSEKLVSEHNITRLAREEEELKRREVKEFVLGMRDGAVTYADNCLSDVEEVLQSSLEEINYITKTMEEKLTLELERIYTNRQEIRTSDLYEKDNNNNN